MKPPRYVRFVLSLAALVLPLPCIAQTISGTVLLKGNPPKRPVLDMRLDPACVRLNPLGALGEEVLVDSKGGLANVLVYIKNGAALKSPLPMPPKVRMNDERCLFQPHVIGLLVNQVWEVINLDPTFHNVHAKSKANPEFNVAMPVKGMIVQHKFQKPEIGIKVVGDLHPWETARVHVLDHPHFSISGSDGGYTIHSLPPGQYTVVTWHEVFGTKEYRAQVTPGSSVTTLNVEFQTAPN